MVGSSSSTGRANVTVAKLISAPYGASVLAPTASRRQQCVETAGLRLDQREHRRRGIANRFRAYAPGLQTKEPAC